MAGSSIERSLCTVLLLLVVGGAVILLDFDVNGVPIVPDVIGWGLLAVAGVQLAAPLREGDHLRRRRQRAGGALVVLAVVSGLDWLLMVAGVRPATELDSGAVVVWDALLMVATVVIGVLVLLVLAAWFRAVGLARSARRLQVSAAVVGAAWGLAALVLTVGALLVDVPVAATTMEVEGPAAGGLLAVLVALLGALVWVASVLLRARAELASELARHDGPSSRSAHDGGPPEGVR